MRRPIANLAFALPILLLAGAGAGQAGELFRVVEPLGFASPSSPDLYRIAVEPAALADAELSLPLPGRAPATARLERIERRAAGDFTWRGFTAPEERVVLTVKNGYVVGLIYAGGEAYEISTLAGGGQSVARLETGRFPACLGALEPELAGGAPPAGAPDPAGSPAGDPATDIDVLVYYTPQARDGAGGVAQIEAIAQGAVDMANTAFFDSEMVAHFDLVGAALSTREDSGSMSADLAWLRGDSATAARRDELAADLVSLIVNGGEACGVGYVMRSVGPAFASSGFQVTARGCAVGNLSFAHEHGHNMGFEHDPANGITPVGASFPYAFGHFVDGSYRTVMSYASECTAGCTRVPHFSNPGISHAGQPTGIADQRDNARVGNATAAVVANFRSAATAQLLFLDGFESGDLGSWSFTVP